MSYGYAPQNSQTSWLPIEFDPPKEWERALELISKRERHTADIINVKVNGQFEQNEQLSAEQWFSTNPKASAKKTRYAYRKVFDMEALNNGPIPAATTLSFPHNIKNIVTPVRIFGTATTNTGKYIPLPYVDTAVPANNIGIYATQTNIVLITGTDIDGSAGNTLEQAYITLEYVKTP